MIEFSVGCIEYNPKEHQNLDAMIALADSKMYRDKKRAHEDRSKNKE